MSASASTSALTREERLRIKQMEQEAIRVEKTLLKMEHRRIKQMEQDASRMKKTLLKMERMRLSQDDKTARLDLLRRIVTQKGLPLWKDDEEMYALYQAWKQDYVFPEAHPNRWMKLSRFVEENLQVFVPVIQSQVQPTLEEIQLFEWAHAEMEF